MSQVSDANESERAEAAALFAKADQVCTFGPSFFLGHLRRFVRDHCPSADEHLPTVQIRLAGGETLDLCHIIGVTPRWVILATREAASHQHEMAIDFVPFEMIQGVRIRTHHAETASPGFAEGHTPAIMSAETLVEAVLPRSGAPEA